MAQLLLINNNTVRVGECVAGDVVGIFSDEHKFTQTEIDSFNIVKMAGIKKEELEIKLKSVLGDIEKSEVIKGKVSKKYFYNVKDETKTKDIKDISKVTDADFKAAISFNGYK